MRMWFVPGFWPNPEPCTTSTCFCTRSSIVLIVYCLLLAYCCLWVPWHRHVSAAIPHWYAGDSLNL